MSTEVIAALIAALASLVVSGVSATASRRSISRAQRAERELADKQIEAQKTLEESKAKWQEALVRLNGEIARIAKNEERRRDEMAELDRYREPLLLAVVDVAHRINNIRNRCFLETYLSGDPAKPRPKTALLGTLYRFARYWAVVEQLYAQVNILRFENNAQTEEVAQCLKKVGQSFASDSFDAGALMFWREEQRAIAALMHYGNPPTVMGYAAFVEQYQERFSDWFASSSTDLTRKTVKDSERLRQLQQHYADLARLLDSEGLLQGEWEWLPPDKADRNRLNC
jgi:hypothetical protein